MLQLIFWHASDLCVCATSQLLNIYSVSLSDFILIENSSFPVGDTVSLKYFRLKLLDLRNVEIFMETVLLMEPR